MTGSDWANCWGEVFQIYRLAGPGPVRVGDLVGLHYPHLYAHWLGCAGNKCAKAVCPGHPTIELGFRKQDYWLACWGEVFAIYAKGKSLNSEINSNDEIAFYFLAEGKWISQGVEQDAVKGTCFGTQRPPSAAKYAPCLFETFRVWKE